MRNTNRKVVLIDGKEYVLTANRELLSIIDEKCPQIFDLASSKTVEEIESSDLDVKLGLKFIGVLDVMFYNMLKEEQPEITENDAKILLGLFIDEYNDAVKNLFRFALSVFQGGTPKDKKKSLNWFQD